MYVCVSRVCLVPSEDGDPESPETETTGGHEPPYGYWKSNLGPVQKQLMLSTTEQPLQPIAKFFHTCVSQVSIVVTNTSDSHL